MQCAQISKLKAVTAVAAVAAVAALVASPVLAQVFFPSFSPYSVPQPATAFYVATSGSDANSGSFDRPFATLSRCQTALQAAAMKTCYIRGGTYNLTSGIALTSADAGETWSYYPGDTGALPNVGAAANGEPILTQSSQFTFFSLAAGADNITIVGFNATGFAHTASLSACSAEKFATNTAAVANLVVTRNTLSNFDCAIFGNSATSEHFDANYVSNSEYVGIGCNACTGGTISNNTVYDTNVDLSAQNGYPIVLSFNGSTPSSGVLVANNSTINSPNWECLDTHGGKNITFQNNLCIGVGQNTGINMVAISSPHLVLANPQAIGNIIDKGAPYHTASSPIITANACPAGTTGAGNNCTTTAAAAAQPGWANNVGYPTQWDWSATFLNQPAAATTGTACGTPCSSQTSCPDVVGTNCIEQWRGCTANITWSNPHTSPCTGGARVATWGYIGFGTCSGGISTGAGVAAWSHPQDYGSSGCGPFGRAHYFRVHQPGDVFYVFPAYYDASTGSNQPWIGPLTDYGSDATTHAVQNLTLVGVTISNTRPVFALNGGSFSNNTVSDAMVFVGSGGAFGPGAAINTTIENIDMDGSPGGTVTGNQGGVFFCETNGMNFFYMRVHDFGTSVPQHAVSGICGCLSEQSGTAWLDQLIDYNNGGTYSSGAATHGIYIDASSNDSNFTVKLTHSYFYNEFYGHLVKVRAQNIDMEGNYIEGGLPQPGYTQGDSMDVDFPNGGTIVAKNNILVKNNSAVGSNGIGISFGEAGTTLSGAPRTDSIDYENNTFVTFSPTWGPYPIFPMQFYYPPQVPGQSGWSGPPTWIVKNNLFIGYPITGLAAQDWRGDRSLAAAFSDINHDFSLPSLITTDSTNIMGSTAYGHIAQPSILRARSTVGAVDGPN